MAVEKRDAHGAKERAPRVRLVPPRIGEVERRTRPERDAQRWTQGLRSSQRRRLGMLLGNVLLLGILVGLPYVRGQQRAEAAQRAHATFLSCLYAAPVRGGLGDFAGEREYFAAGLARADGRMMRCLPLLDTLAASPALFVLPSVKSAEARTREALAFLRAELASAATYQPGLRMPERAPRALALLRKTLREQSVVAGLNAEQVDLPLVLGKAERLPAPAQLPLYAAPDAVLSLWGDDQTLHVAGLDATGLSYLEAEPGKPFTRARLVRPSLLRALVRSDAGDFLVWATKAARCADRADACFGKTTSVAPAPSPLLTLPTARTLAAHLAGRADRALAAQRAGLLLATRTAGARVQLQEFAWSPDGAESAELPALPAHSNWSHEVDDAVVLATSSEPLVLAITRTGEEAQLISLEKSSSSRLATLSGASSPWLTACAQGEHASFAMGDGRRVLLGTLARTAAGLRTQQWPALPLAITNVLDPERANRDRAVSVCTALGVLLVARENDQLSAIVCHEPDAPCQRLQLARGVDHFSVLATERGALVAYAGDQSAQVRVKSIELAPARVSAERVPAACWSKSGLCQRPTLARLGRRILLVAPDGTDLRALESADEGATWTTPSVL
jgi:hypothetical protein